MTPRLPALSLALLLSLAASSTAAEPTVEPAQLPRVPPTEPEAAIATFQVKPGFRVELVAAEPAVIDPIAMSFDEDGNLYVVEMRDYSERRPERLGRIRRLEDRDGDGRFEYSTVYADRLPWPTAVLCYNGGVFVGCTPDLLWMTDRDGDGSAEVQEVLFTGFASDFAPFATNQLNVQALMNSLNWSIDNRIHGATSFSGGKVRRVDSAFVKAWIDRNDGPKGPVASVLDLRGRDFSFDPRTLSMRPESGGGQHGLSFDQRGRKYVCSNSSHLQTLAYEDRYAGRNPHYSLPRALLDIAEDGGAAPVFRLSPDEPWRVLRTRWRVSGLVPGPIEGGGRPSGYFTGATGVTIYRGDAYGDSFLGDAFVGDAGGNLVHRKKVFPLADNQVTARRPADESGREFLASTDNWFRPVQFANAPDGCLYICDMYREVIEHPWSLPQSLKQHLDLNSGNDRGRIYRVVPENFRSPRPPRFSQASTASLVAALESRNGWTRDTAARLLQERHDGASVSPLEKMAGASTFPLARLHALYALDGLGSLSEAVLKRALSDPSEEVRPHAIRLSEHFLSGLSPAAGLLNDLARLSRDPDAGVRRQLAFTLGLFPRAARLQAQQRFADSRETHSGCVEALLNSVGDEAAELFVDLARRGADTGWISGLAGILGARGHSNELALVIDSLSQPSAAPSPSTLPAIAQLALGVERSGHSLAQFDPEGRFSPFFSLARRIAASPPTGSAPEENARYEAALIVLGAAPYDDGAPALLSLVENDPARAGGALTALGRQAAPRLADDLLQRWPRLTPRARADVIALLLKRTERIHALLSALERGTILAGDLSIAHQAALREHKDPGVRQSARRILGRPPTTSRQSVVDRFSAALSLRGDAAQGRALFLARCATCHKVGDDGVVLGPDLATVRNGGKEKLLANILDPSREVNGNFVSYAIETRDGESLVGIIVGENSGSVTLRMAGGTEAVLPRSRLAQVQSQGRSLMPEGLEEGLTPQDLANLMEFVMGN